MSTCCEGTPTYTKPFGSDELGITLQRTSTPIPDGEGRSSEPFSSSTDELFYQSWMDGLIRGKAHRRIPAGADGLDLLWEDNSPICLTIGAALHPEDPAGPDLIFTATGYAAGPGLEEFPVRGVIPAEYAVGPGAAVFGNFPDEFVAADYANCLSPWMDLAPGPGFLPIGVNFAPVSSHASTGMNFAVIPAFVMSVPVPMDANYVTVPGSVNFAAPTPVTIITNGPAPVLTAANLVSGSIAVNFGAYYDPYSGGLGSCSPYEFFVQPFHSPSCDPTLYCNFFLGCSPYWTCCSQPKTHFNVYAG